MVIKTKKKGEGREFPRMINFSTTDEMKTVLHWVSNTRTRKEGRYVSVSEVIRDMITIASKSTVKALEAWEAQQTADASGQDGAEAGSDGSEEDSPPLVVDDATLRAAGDSECQDGPLTIDDFEAIQGEDEGETNAQRRDTLSAPTF